MSRKRRKMKTDDSEGDEFDEFAQSFSMDEVKENLRTVGEKFLKWIIEGVQLERKENIHEIACSVRQMRNFLIEKKRKVEHSKSSRQLKQLVPLSQLLDSANYLTSVAQDYLAKAKGNSKEEKPKEHDETNLHDSSFVDMFLDDTTEKAGANPNTQQDTCTKDCPDDTTHLFKVISSKSILKASFSETLGVQKKISFAKKATKVYENNETSQISLTKSSGSVKSVDNDDHKGQISQIASNQKANTSVVSTGAQTGMQDNSRQASEDMFDDEESIVETSFQEDMFSPAKPKNVKLFKAKNFARLSAENVEENEKFKSAKNRAHILDDSHKIESDPLLSQEYQNTSPNACAASKEPQTDAKVPFHNFVLTLPQDSSGSEASLDARVNMALNLVSIKPREPDIKQQPLPEEVETPKNSTYGIVQSTITCTDFRWMEPIDYNREISQDSPPEDAPHFKAPLPSASMFEDLFSENNYLPPFDIKNEDTAKILGTPFLDAQPQGTSFHELQNRPQMGSSSIGSKPIWANPFQSSIAQSNSNRQRAQTKPVALESRTTDNSIKSKIQSLVESNSYKNLISKNRKENIAPKKQDEGDSEVQNLIQQIPESIRISDNPKSTDHSQTIETGSEAISGRSQTLQSSLAKRGSSKNLQSAEQPNEMADVLQKTYDSHELAKATKYRTRQSFKKALKEVVLTAKSKRSVDKHHQNRNTADTKAAEATVELPGTTSTFSQDSSRIARLRRFGKSWNEPSLTPVPETNKLDGTTVGRSKFKQNTKIQVKPLPKIKSKSSEGELPRTKEQLEKLEGDKSRYTNNQNSSEAGKYKIKPKQENWESLKKETKVQERREDTTQTPIGKSATFPSSTPLPDTVLLERAQPENPAWSSKDIDGVTPINTSSMICETSHSGEISSEGCKKLTTSCQEDEQVSQNQQTPGIEQPKVTLKQSQYRGLTTGSLKEQNNKLVEVNSRQKVTKRGRGRRPKSGNSKPMPKKQKNSSTLGSVSTSISHSEPQLVNLFDNSLLSNMESTFWNQQGFQPSNPAQQNMPSSKPDSAQTEQGFLKFQQVQNSAQSFKPISTNSAVNTAIRKQVQPQKRGCHIPTSNKREEGGNSFFTPHSENTTNHFDQLFNQPFLEDRPTTQTGWQFNFPSNSQVEPFNQNYQGPKAQAILSEPHIQAPNINLTLIVTDDSRTNDADVGSEKTTEPKTSSLPLPSLAPSTERPQERTFRSQPKKRTGPECAQQSKSPKMKKLQETKSRKDIDDINMHSLETQGTKVLYEECENLSWAANDFLDTQIFNSQTINTEIFDSQNFLLGNADYSALLDHQSQTENQEFPEKNEPPFQYEARTQLSWGFTAECEGTTSGLQEPQAQADCQYPKDFGPPPDYAEDRSSRTFSQHKINVQFNNQDLKRDSETSRSQNDTNQPAYAEFKQGVQVSSTELTGNAKPPEHSKELAKTKAEELDDLINSIEWIRRIPESELIPASNIEELINDQTFIW